MRIGDVDLERGTISITKSRDEHAEAAPKTEKSRREIPLLPNVLDVLRSVEHPPNADAGIYFFRNPDGGPVATTWWPKKSWFPVLKKIGIRRRKFYATRHTFVSWARTQGMNLKAIAKYVGTSHVADRWPRHLTFPSTPFRRGVTFARPVSQNAVA